MFKLISLKASGFKRLDLQDKMVFPDGRMLIHGRNESGKSTILEAIHYALYGFALRPTKRAGKEDLICYGKPSAVIELEFSIDDAEYQVRREIKRKGSNVHYRCSSYRRRRRNRSCQPCCRRSFICT